MESEDYLDSYTAGDVRRILAEVKRNPNGHSYPPELIERFKKFEADLESLNKPLSDSVFPGVKSVVDEFAQKDYWRGVGSFRTPLTRLSRHVSAVNQAFSHKFMVEINPVFEYTRRIKEAMESIPSAWGAAYSNFTLFSKRGWYISHAMIEDCSLSELHNYLQDKFAFEEFVRQEVDSKLPDMVQRFKTSFPERTEIFDEIQNLYSAGFYYGVVALCYTQVDGVSNEIFGCGFFDRKRDEDEQWKLKTYILLQGVEMHHSNSIVDQLQISTNEITAYSESDWIKKIERRKKSYNRHLVLHGHSVAYGTKINAVRAICMLDFLHYLTEAVYIESISK